MNTKSSKVNCYIFLIIEGLNAKTELDFFNALWKEYNHYLKKLGIIILEPLTIDPFAKQKKKRKMSTKLKLNKLKTMCQQNQDAKVILVCDNDHQIKTDQLRINWEMIKKYLKEQKLTNQVYLGLYPEGETIEYLLVLTYPKEFAGYLVGENKPFNSLDEVKKASPPGNLKKIESYFQNKTGFNQFNPVEELMKNIKPLKLTPPILLDEWQICWSQIFKQSIEENNTSSSKLWRK